MFAIYISTLLIDAAAVGMLIYLGNKLGKGWLVGLMLAVPLELVRMMAVWVIAGDNIDAGLLAYLANARLFGVPILIGLGLSIGYLKSAPARQSAADTSDTTRHQENTVVQARDSAGESGGLVETHDGPRVQGRASAIRLRWRWTAAVVAVVSVVAAVWAVIVSPPPLCIS